MKIVTSVLSRGILRQFCTNLILTLEWLVKNFFSDQTGPYIAECKKCNVKFWLKLRLLYDLDDKEQS